MSALIYVMQKEQIVSVMDTLAVDCLKKRPLLFTNKMYLLPDLSTIVCGTGVGQFISDWFSIIQTKIYCDSIDYINENAQQYLSELWGKIPKSGSNPTSTVYHFGYSKKEKCFVGAAFRSVNHFSYEKQYS